jgi:rhamnosyltransferase
LLVTSAAGVSEPDLAPGRRPEHVGAVIVTYFAQEDALARLLDVVRPQVEHAVVVDNTPGGQVHATAGVDHIANGANLGLAAAQNQGIEHLRQRGITHVLLLDQDSLPAGDMVRELLRVLRALQRAGTPVAAVGPRWRDRLSGRDVPFVRLALGRMVPAGAAGSTDDAVVECDTLVSSGCLIPLAVVDRIGPMDAALFIDQVDTEWGLRAQAAGLGLYGAPRAVLAHGIGESFVRPWFARGRAVPVHSPVRDYYWVRNTIAVIFRRAAPWRWRLLYLVRLPGVILVMATQMPERGRRLSAILRGLRDGLLLRLGPAR